MNPIIDGILVMEGGYTNNPKDKGGATNWGITEATARAHGYTGEMINLTRAEAFSILEEDYWIKPDLSRSQLYPGPFLSNSAMPQSILAPTILASGYSAGSTR